MKANATILVTGGAGFIGTHLCRKLVGLGHRVTALDLKTASTPVQGVEYVQGDVRNTALVEKLTNGIDVVYHFAATVSVPLCQKDPIESYSNNFTSTLIILDALRTEAKKARTTPPALVFASTAALYGDIGNDGRSIKEMDLPAEFGSFYAAQKHASEKAIQLYANFHGIPATVFRFFNVFGPGQDPTSPYSGVITVLMKLAREGKSLPLNGGGSQTRDFISVHDIVSACKAALDVPLAQWTAAPMNLGTGKSITVRQLGEMISKMYQGAPKLVDAPPREGDVLHSRADITRASQRLGFAPIHGLEKGLLEI
jgi:UDP-glucose 4-epimerase